MRSKPQPPTDGSIKKGVGGTRNANRPKSETRAERRKNANPGPISTLHFSMGLFIIFVVWDHWPYTVIRNSTAVSVQCTKLPLYLFKITVMERTGPGRACMGSTKAATRVTLCKLDYGSRLSNLLISLVGIYFDISMILIYSCDLGIVGDCSTSKWI